jgi:hypothetical protein
VQSQKFIHQFKAGDLVHAHGAIFRILENARESIGHRPQADHMVIADGPSDTAKADAEWVSGNIIPGYFGPDTRWAFQGNFLAGRYIVERV